MKQDREVSDVGRGEREGQRETKRGREKERERDTGGFDIRKQPCDSTVGGVGLIDDDFPCHACFRGEDIERNIVAKVHHERAVEVEIHRGTRADLEEKVRESFRRLRNSHPMKRGKDVSDKSTES